MSDHIGEQFGNYVLTRLLGKGGFAEVYLGQHVYLKNLAAIKILLTQLGENEIAGFLAEARTLATLKHPHIVRILDFGMQNNIPFIVMEYASNGTMRQRYPRGVAIAPESVVAYVKQIASALQYAHDQKLIHRDIKPENMLLDDNNGILLSDFGVALVARSSQWQKTSEEVAGTATYMAPEQISGKPQRSSDQYALGAMVYEWLTGEALFHGSFTEICAQHLCAAPPSLRAKMPMLAPEMEEVIMTALAKEPEQRFASVQAFASALEQAYQYGKLAAPAIANMDTVPYRSDQRPQQPYSFYSPQQPIALSDPFAAEQKMFPSTQYSEPRTSSQNTPAAGQNYAPGNTRPPKRSFPLLLFFLVLIVGIIGGGFYYAYGVPHQTAQTSPTPTPRATATPTPTPTVGPSASGSVVYSSSLHAQDAQNWDVGGFSGNGYCRFENNVYHIYMPAGNNYVVACFAQKTNFSGDFTLTATMTLNQGLYIGVCFRRDANDPNSNYYRFSLNPSKAWDLVDAKSLNTSNQFASGASDAIKGLGQSNTVKLVARGTTFYFYANDHMLGTTQANTASGGMIGFFTVSSPSQTADASFSSISVQEP